MDMFLILTFGLIFIVAPIAFLIQQRIRHNKRKKDTHFKCSYCDGEGNAVGK